MPVGADELEDRKDDLKEDINELTKTHEKQVLLIGFLEGEFPFFN